MAAKAERRPGMYLSLRTTLEWARELAGPGGVSVAVPLDRLAALRGIAPRTLRDHLARLEGLGLLTRVYAGQAGLSIRTAPEEPDSVPDNRGAGAYVPSAAESVAVQPVSEQVLESVSLLTRAGVYPQLARSLARKPWVTPDLIAAWVHELRHVRAVRALAAVLVHTLQDPERCLPPPETPAATPGAGQHRARYRGSESDNCQAPADGQRLPANHAVNVEEMSPLARLTSRDRSGEFGGPLDRDGSRIVSEDQAAGHQAVTSESVAGALPPRLERVTMSRTMAGPPQPGARPAQPPEHAVLWETVHRALAGRLPAEMDALWLRPAHALSFSDGVLIVAVPSTIGAEWLNLAGAPRARDAIQQVAGTRLVVRFVPAGLREHASD